jgi:GDP-D-mannose dehydratase
MYKYIYKYTQIYIYIYPDDYVLATNETHSVREFIEKAFLFIKIVIKWEVGLSIFMYIHVQVYMYI